MHKWLELIWLNMYLLEQYKKIVNDTLVDDENLKWKLHTSRMMNGQIYTKTTWLSYGRFRFDIEYYSDKQYFFIFCRYENNNIEYTNGTNKTVTLNQLKIDGNCNEDIYNAINEWKKIFINEVNMIC